MKRNPTLDPSDEELLNQMNKVGERSGSWPIPIDQASHYSDALEMDRIKTRLEVKYMKQQVQYAKTLSIVTGVLAFATIVLALATVALVVATLYRP